MRTVILNHEAIANYSHNITDKGNCTYTFHPTTSMKDDPNLTHVTIGKNHICYPGNTGTKTGSLEVVKLLLNSVLLSHPNAKFTCFIIKNIDLGIPLDHSEHVQIKLTDIFARGGWIYFEITKASTTSNRLANCQQPPHQPLTLPRILLNGHNSRPMVTQMVLHHVYPHCG